MFDTRKFGAFLARLRKNADMTQSRLADKLNLTRQSNFKVPRRSEAEHTVKLSDSLAKNGKYIKCGVACRISVLRRLEKLLQAVTFDNIADMDIVLLS